MPEKIDIEQLFTCAEAARLLKVAPSTLYEYASRNEVPHVVVRRGKHKHTIRFDPAALRAWIRSQTITPGTLAPAIGSAASE